MGDDDPENTFSAVPYEKGSQYMLHIESILGTASMQSFLRAYVGEFTQQAITSLQFKEFYDFWITENFPDNATEIIDLTLHDVWVYEPGVAPTDLDFSTVELEATKNLADSFILLAGQSAPQNYTDYFNYWKSQKQSFVEGLDTDEVDANLLVYIDSLLSLSKNESNPAVKTQWYELGIRKKYDGVLEPAHVWLGQQGRQAFVRPVFRELVDANKCDVALEWFDEYKATYNSYVVNSVSSVLKECSEDDLPPVSSPSTTVDLPGSSSASWTLHGLWSALVATILLF